MSVNAVYVNAQGKPLYCLCPTPNVQECPVCFDRMARVKGKCPLSK